jgi:arginyl-tRNA synthetase
MTQDIGTAIKKFEDFQMQYNLYVVADEQNLHFKNLFAILSLLGFAWAKNCHHISYGMVILPKGMGKVKSREGTAVDADQLIAEMTNKVKEGKNFQGDIEDKETTARQIALAALKVFMLQVSSDKTIQFDPGQSIDFHGDTGPFIQYEYARIKSILRKAHEQKITVPSIQQTDFSALTEEQEHLLALHIQNFPSIVRLAGEQYNPTLITQYLLQLSRAFSKFYDRCPVLKEGITPEIQQARLVLCQAVAPVIKAGMGLLGVEVPERM